MRSSLIFISYAAAARTVLRQEEEASRKLRRDAVDADSIDKLPLTQICDEAEKMCDSIICEETWDEWQRAAEALEVRDGRRIVDVREELSDLVLLTGVGGGRSGSAMLSSRNGALFVKSLETAGIVLAERMAADYYEHIEAATKGAPSLLTTIGICKFRKGFTSHPKGHTHAVIMTNLRRFDGIVQSFDLKGSKWKNLVDRKARRCDKEFVDKSEQIAKYLAGDANAMVASRSDYKIAEGEDLDFVATRSDSYREEVTGLKKHQCWARTKGEADMLGARTRLPGGGFADKAEADMALATQRPGADADPSEQEGIPMYLPAQRFDPFWAQLERDVAFLQQQGLMDYSLALNVVADPRKPDTCQRSTPDALLIPVVEESKSIAVGIIDFYTTFHAGKVMSKFGQRVSRMFAGHRKSSYKTGEPQGFDTIAPVEYGNRFLGFFGRWLRSCNTGSSSDVHSSPCCTGTGV